MSSSLMPCAMIDICSCLRSPALNAFSWRIRYSTFSAAKCGASGSLAMPSRPWQTAQVPCATFLPAAGSAAKLTLAAQAAAMSAAAATECFIDALQRKRAAAFTAARGKSLAVRDAIHRSGEIVGDQERAVAQLRDVDRAADIFAVGVQPTHGELLLLAARGTVIVERREQHARADRRGAVPRAVLGGEDALLVFGREL